MTTTDSRSPHAAATAVLPTPVGPTRTGVRGRARRSTPPKPPLELVAGQLHDRRPPVHVVRRERRRQQPTHELAHRLDFEPLPGLDRRSTGERGRKALEPVRPAAESAAREIRYQLLEAARRIEPRA